MKQKYNNEDDEVRLRISDRILPVANVSNIMKNSVPPETKISKGAKELVQKSASEFIAFVSHLAKQFMEQDGRRTVNGEDLIKALRELGFDNYAEIAAFLNERYSKKK